MNKVAIVMTYYKRLSLIMRTLTSILNYGYNHNLDIIIVDDNSQDNLQEVVKEVFKNDRIHFIVNSDKDWTNPVIAYNRGIEKAIELGSNYVILQNAENIHRGDIIKYGLSIINSKNYISFPCYSIDKETTKNYDIVDINTIISENDRCFRYDGDNGWYNHNIYRNSAYDFCSMIKIDNLKKLNGYDERFAHGVAFGDDDLIRRVRTLGLKVIIPSIDTGTPIVVHQWHYSSSPYSNSELVLKNKELHSKLSIENNYRAEHLKTKDF